MLSGIEIKLNTSYKEFTALHGEAADKIVYTGMIDEFFDFKLGVLEYRTIAYLQSLSSQALYKSGEAKPLSP